MMLQRTKGKEQFNSKCHKLACLMSKIAPKLTFFTGSAWVGVFPTGKGNIEEHRSVGRGDGFSSNRVVKQYTFDEAMGKARKMIDEHKTSINELENWLDERIKEDEYANLVTSAADALSERDSK